MTENKKKLLLDSLKKYENSKEYEHYREQENVVVNLFKTHPKNDDFEKVLLKVCVLNSFYSTNLKGKVLSQVAKHIVKLNIDTRLEKGDTSVVEDVANFTDDEGKKTYIYSFASKYCFHHNNDAFVIYDQFVGESLKYFNCDDETKKRIYHSKILSKKFLKKYENLLEAIAAFRKFYTLTQNNRDVDHMLWVYGRENLNK
ncbi:hypothetical protein B6S12_00890 [Helicobacter valdiviensis]|uniref:Uncharacterized protein n=1 Tax=Helicobacter valdiviensis TaxID=1458358 RepID=A0A2W6PQ81_9HELI|nr:hypothetical protein [Helicobacter valdiviensis]PZT48883.1 hypothetical protein B6S12_00890 [Helicobacter valdiviensis]